MLEYIQLPPPFFNNTEIIPALFYDTQNLEQPTEWIVVDPTHAGFDLKCAAQVYVSMRNPTGAVTWVKLIGRALFTMVG